MASFKSLQSTSAEPVSWHGVDNLIVTFAFGRQSPAAVAEFCSSYSHKP